jgi:predicted nucleic acid-binding protein
VPEGLAICNTGPLIALSKIQRIDLLSDVFAEILIPQAVFTELEHGRKKGLVGAVPASAKIIASNNPPNPVLVAQLDFGEASVIQLAVETPHSEILIDERRARRIATGVYALSVLGTGGLLLRAKKRGLITEIKPLLVGLRDEGYYLGDELVQGLLHAAAEADEAA